MASCVAFTDQGVLVGNEARSQRTDNPSRTICDVRTLLGQRWSDPKVQEIVKSLHYRVEGKEGKPVVKVDIQGRENTFTPEQIAGMLMAKLGHTAAATIGDYMGCAVMAVPSSFNDNQRQAVKDAGTTVGLNVIRIINEPAAVAIGYELDRLDDEQNVLVLDMGASKTDVTMLYIDQGVIEILATVSTPISGRLFNRRLVDYIAAQCASEGVLLDRQARIRLEESIEDTQRHRLFGPSAYCLPVDSLKHCPGLSNSKIKPSTRDFGTDLTAEVIEPLEHVLDASNMTMEWEESRWFPKEDMPYIPSSINNVGRVLAIGGFSKSPMATWLLDALRRNDPWTDRDFDAEEAVLKGAAIQARVLSDEEPVVASYVSVTLLSLGLETSEGYMHKIVPRRVPIPKRRVQNLTTAYDDQDSMVIRFLEGDRMMARDNLLLGEIELTGIPRAPRHVPVVEISFEVDSLNILKVIARCLGTNIEASAIFNNTAVISGVPYKDIEQLAFEAEYCYPDKSQRQFEDTTPIDKAGMKRYIDIVERAMSRGDVVDVPGAADDLKK
ncbi:hypothetical protein INS49_004722 [Diaporthe citri]|uniref:uncharacterized protein n=1 Tax=Diaporthe citri TaxID=83186 RepID=UPI001C7E84A8|nr:uncharacterized protein INS49_004722 [Diaporthe citri]KAG6354704.1 hypothetical protein INS49_004722 [Diaporthe citri]